MAPNHIDGECLILSFLSLIDEGVGRMCGRLKVWGGWSGCWAGGGAPKVVWAPEGVGQAVGGVVEEALVPGRHEDSVEVLASPYEVG